ncbi:MAG: hypothetical protein JW741_15600 [Sedimentisphaerales bacterium]|nr:hypothetical protein [Sedimentisphaerales bacterium]
MIEKDMPPRADTNDVKTRVEKARFLWQNGETDPEPVIFYAMFISPRPGPYALWVSGFDEDKDIVGLGIREERIGEGGRRIVREEQYPVYIHIAPFYDELLRESIVPIRIRDSGQAMDAQQWANYVRAEPEEAGEGIFSETAYWSSNWEETLPPVWVSFPEPNVVDVYAYAYDKAGRKSTPVQVGVWLGVQDKEWLESQRKRWMESQEKRQRR